MSDPFIVLAVVLISLVAAVAQTATGSGYGIVAAPLLVFVEPLTVPGPLLVSTIVVMAVVVTTHRHAVALADLRPALVWAVPGVVVGFVVAGLSSPALNMIAVGVIVLAGVAAAVSGVRVPSSVAALRVAGALAGVFTVIAATPGPPLTVVYRPEESDRLRANLSAFFLLSSVGTLIPLVLLTEAVWPPLDLTLGLCLGAVVGVLVARPFLKVLAARTIRVGSLALCALAGTSLLVRAVGQLPA